jgi:hypothetical protein
MKYFLSLCCIIKNERNLEELIIYYKILGVEHFYIYDNESDFPIKDRLNSFFYKKYCSIINFPGKYKQLEAYNDCINKTKDETKWLILCDGDEYIVPKKDNYCSIRDFLNDYNHAHAIGINWVMFGTSYYDTKQEGFLIDKYRHSSSTQNKHIKTICQPKYVSSVNGPHNVNLHDPSKYIDAKNNIINSPFNENYTIDIIQMNHYHSKSKEELIEKSNRGNADSDKRVNVPDDIHSFDNEIINNFISDKYLNDLRKIYNMTGVNWQIYRALNKDLTQAFNNEEEIIEHLLKYGLQENRPFHITDKFPDFNRQEYRNKNPQLHNLNDLDLELYYISQNI